jgi:hypothetical protein
MIAATLPPSLLCARGKGADFRSWHLSEVVVPMRDVRSWGKTGVRRETGKE